MSDLPLQVDRVLAVAAEGRAWGDEWVRDQLGQAKQVGLGETVCAGCDLTGCCKQPVMTTWIDAMPIAVQLHKTGLNSKRIRQGYIAVGLYMEEALVAGAQENEVYPCPFLRRRRCAVYDVRPMICRAYYTFEDRSNCIPYSERTDGLRPKACLLDHAPAVGVSLQVAMDLAEDLGAPNPRMPWIRALPFQVATLMAALDDDSIKFWPHVWENCRMPSDQFSQMYIQQAADPMERVTW